MVEILVFEIDGYILRGIHRRIRNLHRYRNGLARACLHLIVEEGIGGAVDRQTLASGHSNDHVFYIDGTAGVAEFEGQVKFGACRHAATAVVETGNNDVRQRTGCCIIGRILGFFLHLGRYADSGRSFSDCRGNIVIVCKFQLRVQILVDTRHRIQHTHLDLPRLCSTDADAVQLECRVIAGHQKRIRWCKGKNWVIDGRPADILDRNRQHQLIARLDIASQLVPRHNDLRRRNRLRRRCRRRLYLRLGVFLAFMNGNFYIFLITIFYTY